MFAQNQPTRSKKSFKADTNSGKISAHTNKPAPQLMHANFDPFKSEVYLVNPFTSQLDSPEPFVFSEHTSSFPDDYTGTKTLIGENTQRMAPKELKKKQKIIIKKGLEVARLWRTANSFMCLSSKVSHLTVQLQSRTTAGDRNSHEMEMFFIFFVSHVFNRSRLCGRV